ncbi:hypothetical protein FHS89_001215 [Rubricella aquisinus]|uniref:HTH cro/C1-type domain-containing protein n=1 Tax=Rubricella aquisinus TaxID=2028108 RepID=A0A840WZW7_9RHOB|nr:XRE family transcriptional regulator [Rubricella aquisinus]MBB5515205.1 hypothetical protein [Rubricella aquisinus]
MRGSFAGLRIRERRRALGLSQTALAERAGISPSYLNLIEHNKRGIAGKVLLSLARELDLPPSALSKEAELSLIGDLRQAAADMPVDQAEADVTEEFVSRYPGWARLVNTLHGQVRAQRTAIDALSDRLTHDPFLQTTLHEVLTRITAVHSTVEILATVPDIPDDQRARFLRNVNDESARLANVARELTQYFDDAVEQDQPTTLPDEEVERFFAQRQNRVPELEAEAADTSTITELLQASELRGEEARRRAQTRLSAYLEEARALPLEPFQAAARKTGYDVAALARQFGQPIPMILRRLSRLQRRGGAGPLFGLVSINAAGHLAERIALPGFPIPRHGAACALWPVYQSLAQPGRTERHIVDLATGGRFITLTHANYADSGTVGLPGPLTSTMLIVDAGDAAGTALTTGLAENTPAVAAGTGCRICPRPACASRAEPAIMTAQI